MTSLNPDHCAELLSWGDPAVLRDLHRLLWIQPLVNNGDPDPGWSCRDHVFVLGCLLHHAGIRVRAVHGKAVYVFIGGPGAAPIGIGQDGNVRGMHAWLSHEGADVVDVSPNLNAFTLNGRALEFLGIMGDFIPAAVGSSLVLVDSSAEFENQIALATHRPSGLSAVYWPNHAVAFGGNHIADPFGYINSPLSHRLQERFDARIYFKAAVHISGVRSGSRRSIAGVSQNKAWNIVDGLPDEDADRFKDALLEAHPF